MPGLQFFFCQAKRSSHVGKHEFVHGAHLKAGAHHTGAVAWVSFTFLGVAAHHAPAVLAQETAHHAVAQFW